MQHSGNTTAQGFIKFGNKDADKDYDLSSMRVRPDMYVVRHFNVATLPSGETVEDPGSNRIQVYEKEIFKKLSAQPKTKDGSQAESAFEQQGLNIDILHEPE